MQVKNWLFMQASILGFLAFFATTSMADCDANVSVQFITNGSYPRAHVTIDALPSSCECRVIWNKEGSKLGSLATPWRASTSFTISRLVANSTTQVSVYSRSSSGDIAADDGTMIFQDTFSVPATQWSFLTDSGSPFVYSLSGTPSWELLALDAHSYNSDPAFSGFIVVDAEGDIVWMFNITTQTHTADMGPFPTHCIDQRVLAKDDFSEEYEYSFVMQSMIPDTPLGIVDPSSGEILEVLPYDNADCPARIITHEARLEENGNFAYTLQTTWGEFEGLEHPQLGNQISTWTFSADEDRLVRGAGLSRTFESGPRRPERSTAEDSSVQVLYDLFDYFDPVTERGMLSDEGQDDGGFPMECNGNQTIANDWSHANSVSVSSFDNSLIVSIRQFSTVCSFKPPPLLGGINWCVSSELPDRSDFKWENATDQFFNQHAALQLADGNIVLFDNGNSRPESNYIGGKQFSRGIEYAFDQSAGTIKKVWELRTAYDSHQGSVYPIGESPEKYIVHVPNSNGDRRRRLKSEMEYQTEMSGISAAYEVDKNGNVLSTLKTRIYSDTAYRGVPFDSINGEYRLS